MDDPRPLRLSFTETETIENSKGNVVEKCGG